MNWALTSLVKRGTLDTRLPNSVRKLHPERRCTTRALRKSITRLRKQASSLEQFSNWGIGYNTGVDVKRNFLERELSNLRKERRSLLVKTWDDIGRLRKEFRQLVREYKAMLSRLDLL